MGKKLGVKPNAFHHNYVINCASCMEGNEREKMDAFKIALSAFQDLRKCQDEETDSFTYSFFLKACYNLLPQSSGKLNIMRQTFTECCERGKVNEEVISRLKRCLPHDVAKELLECSGKTKLRQITKRDLPPQWSRNTNYRI